MIKRVVCLMISLMLCSCINKVPLIKNSNEGIDPRLIGKWVDKKNKENEKILIFKFSDNEYFVKIDLNSEPWYYKMYIVKVEDIKYLQLQLIGSDKIYPNENTKDNKNLTDDFFVLKYEIINSEIKIDSMFVSGGNEIDSAKLLDLFKKSLKNNDKGMFKALNNVLIKAD